MGPVEQGLKDVVNTSTRRSSQVAAMLAAFGMCAGLAGCLEAGNQESSGATAPTETEASETSTVLHELAVEGGGQVQVLQHADGFVGVVFVGALDTDEAGNQRFRDAVARTSTVPEVVQALHTEPGFVLPAAIAALADRVKATATAPAPEVAEAAPAAETVTRISSALTSCDDSWFLRNFCGSTAYESHSCACGQYPSTSPTSISLKTDDNVHATGMARDTVHSVLFKGYYRKCPLFKSCYWSTIFSSTVEPRHYNTHVVYHFQAGGESYKFTAEAANAADRGVTWVNLGAQWDHVDTGGSTTPTCPTGVVRCGLSTCLSGEFADYYTARTECSGYSSGNNATYCVPVCGSSLTTCDSTCPSGYTQTSFTYTSSCSRGTTVNNTRTCGK